MVGHTFDPQFPNRTKLNIIDIDDDYTMSNADDIVNVTVDTKTISLPDVTKAFAKSYTIKNSSTGDITWASTASQEVDGTTGATLATHDYLEVTPNEGFTAWIAF